MSSKGTSWIYYSTCAIQVLKAGKQGCVELSALLGCGQEAAAGASVSCWQDLALLHPQELQVLRMAARLSMSPSESVNLTQEEGVLGIWEPFCPMLMK